MADAASTVDRMGGVEAAFGVLSERALRLRFSDMLWGILLDPTFTLT